MAKENDAYAICTAQKKKSGMGHDAWKRCIEKVKKEESIMKFSDRVISILEKKRLKNEGDDYDDPEADAAVADAEGSEGEADAKADASLDASKKSRMKKKLKEKMGNKEGGTNAKISQGPEDQSDDEAESELDDEDTLGEEVDCTARANAVKARTGSAAQAQSEYNRCKKEQGDDNRDDSNPANQKAKRVMQGFPKTGRSDSGPENSERQLEKKDWINKAADSIEDRGTEGKCTPITKKGCTGRAEALAKTFKKIGKKRDAKIVSKKEKAAKKK